MELVRSGFSKSPASLERMREVVRRRHVLRQKGRGRKKKRNKRKLPRGSSPRSLPARVVRTRKSGHLSCGSSWCSVSGCCLTCPGLLDYWVKAFPMFPYSTLSLVRFWIHALASVYASFRTAPCIWPSLVRRCLCLRSTVSPFFWEMTPRFAVFSASWLYSGYMYCQSTKAWIFHIFLHGFTRILRSFLVLLFLSSFLAVACAKLDLLVILHLALFLFLFSGPDARHHCGPDSYAVACARLGLLVCKLRALCPCCRSKALMPCIMAGMDQAVLEGRRRGRFQRSCRTTEILQLQYIDKVIVVCCASPASRHSRGRQPSSTVVAR